MIIKLTYLIFHFCREGICLSFQVLWSVEASSPSYLSSFITHAYQFTVWHKQPFLKSHQNPCNCLPDVGFWSDVHWHLPAALGWRTALGQSCQSPQTTSKPVSWVKGLVRRAQAATHLRPNMQTPLCCCRAWSYMTAEHQEEVHWNTHTAHHLCPAHTNHAVKYYIIHTGLHTYTDALCRQSNMPLTNTLQQQTNESDIGTWKYVETIVSQLGRCSPGKL